MVGMTTYLETQSLTNYILATYRVEDRPASLEKRAEGIAVGLTVGSWTDLPQAKQAHMLAYRGQVADIEVIGDGNEPGTVRAHMTIAYPIVNLTNRIPALLTTIFGKLSMDGKIRLVRIEMPEAYTKQFPGPKLGVTGLRSRFGVHNRPFLMSIFKSCIGLSLDELCAQFREQALGGVDLIKDDEIFFSEAGATPEDRVKRYAAIAKEVSAETGKEVGYAVNLTGPTRSLFERAKRLSHLGAGALLLNVLAYGYDVLQELAEDASIQAPIMAHPAVAGALYGGASTGIGADIVLGQLMRLGGADIVIYPSPYGSVTLAKEEGQMLLDAVRRDNGLRPSLPAPSAGIHPGMVPTLLEDCGLDLIVNAGGAIHGHPDGSTAGGQAFVAAIEASLSGVTLREASEGSSPLARALEKWGTLQ